MFVLASVALAAMPDWEALPAATDAAWEAGPGDAWRQRQEGLDAARRRVPRGPTAVRGETQAFLEGQEQWLVTVEQPLDFGGAAGRRWRAELLRVDAASLGARWAFTREVQDAFFAWWLAEHEVVHLQEWVETLQADRLRIEGALEAGVLARDDLDEVLVAAARARTDLTEAEGQRVRAAAQLELLLGTQLPRAEVVSPALDGPNPWAEAEALVPALPTVREAEARAAAARLEAAAAGWSRAPVLEAGPMWALDPAGELAPLLYASVRVPLGEGAGSDRRAARGEAAAAAVDADWQRRRARTDLEALARAWDVDVARRATLRDEVLVALEGREQRLENALAQGLVPADRLVRARRERHETEHELAGLTGALLASRARARALVAQVEEEG